MFIDVYLYLIGCALNMKGTKRGRKSRCSSKNRRKIFFVRVGINGFLRNTIHYTRGSLPEERKTLARTHEGGLLNRWRTKEFEAITHETLSPDRIREEHGVCVFDVNDSMLTYSTDARFDVKAKFSFLSRWPWSFPLLSFSRHSLGRAPPRVCTLRVCTGFHTPDVWIRVWGCRRG